MRKITIIILTLIIAMVSNTISVNAISYNTGYNNNKTVAMKYCKKHYKNYKIKIVNTTPKNHKSNKYIYVQRVKTISCGGYIGKVSKNSIVRYCKPITKNRIHYCYMVFNPKNNVHDDVVAFISNGKLK